MAGPFDHYLAILAPRDARQFAQRLELGKLRGIVGVRDRPGSQSIAQRKTHVVGATDIADLFEMLVEKAFTMMREAPLRHDGAATGDDTCDAPRR
jgi:hypothetical protein